MTRGEFTGLVEEALQRIPQQFRDAIRNMAIVIKQEPTRAQLASVEIAPPWITPVAGLPTISGR